MGKNKNKQNTKPTETMAVQQGTSPIEGELISGADSTELNSEAPINGGADTTMEGSSEVLGGMEDGNTGNDLDGGTVEGNDGDSEPNGDELDASDVDMAKLHDVTSQLFAEASELAKDDRLCKIHLDNLMSQIKTLVNVEVANLSSTKLKETGACLISIAGSFARISDEVFVAAFPASLTAIYVATQDEKLMLSNTNKTFRIFSGMEQTSKTIGLPNLLTGMIHLSDPKLRNSRGSEIDVAEVFKSLPDVKRNVIKTLLR